MNIDHYKNFVTVVELHSISAAAKHIHIAQSALSNQVKAFEELLGAKLLIRGARTVELTDAGRIFYEASRNIARLDDSAQTEIRGLTLGQRGILKLGLTPALPDNQIKTLLHHFAEHNPLVSFDIHEANSDELIELLKNGIVEVAVIRTPAHIPSILSVTRTYRESFYAFYRPDAFSIQDRNGTISFKNLQSFPLSIPRGFQQLIIECCQQHDFSPHLLSTSSSREMTLLWAELGHAIAILSSGKNVPLHSDQLKHCEILDSNLLAQRSIVTLRGKTLSSVAQRFLENIELSD